jgi:hypothetical protein
MKDKNDPRRRDRTWYWYDRDGEEYFIPDMDPEYINRVLHMMSHQKSMGQLWKIKKPRLEAVLKIQQNGYEPEEFLGKITKKRTRLHGPKLDAIKDKLDDIYEVLIDILDSQNKKNP